MTERRFKIEYERDRCIGAGICVAFSPKSWKMNIDGKADLLNGKKEGEIWSKEIHEEEFEENKQAAEGCPVNVIHLIDLQIKKRLI